MDDAGYQLEKVLGGLDETTVDRKVCPAAMSAREMVVHLTECYLAAVTEAAGQKFEWGSYRPEDQSWPTVMAEFKAKRAEAVAAVSGDDEKRVKLASAFIIGHDYYHVGQLVLHRLEFTPGWDAYSIYRWE